MCLCDRCTTGVDALPPDESTKESWLRLKEKLLAFGGTGVVWPNREPELAALLKRGQLIEAKVQHKPMPMNECHSNAAILWERDIDSTRLYTGYALDDDGNWLQHSWVMKRGQLIETTVPFDKYFGTRLTDLGALHFWLNNAGVCLGCAAHRLTENPKLSALYQRAFNVNLDDVHARSALSHAHS